MEPLVRATLAVRMMARRGHGLIAACVLSAYVASGGARAGFGPLQAALIALWMVLVAIRAARKLRDPGDAKLLVDFEIGALLAVGLVALLVRFDGGLSGRLSPSLYILVAFVAAFARPLAGIGVAAWLLGLEALVRFGAHDSGSAAAFATHVCFVGALAVLNFILLRAEVVRVRKVARARIEAQLVRLKEDARSYRLLGSGGEPGAADEARGDRLARASVEEIHQSVHYALDLLRRTLDLYTAVLLWLNDAGTHLRISELSTASDAVSDAPFRAGDGVLGAVVAARETLSMHGLKASFKVPYYSGPCPVRALAAIPVLEGDALRGVLVLDRLENSPFTSYEEELAAQAARFCLRAIQNERVFVQLERARVEQGKLYRAAQALAAALSESDVVAAGVAAAREIASFDAAAVTVYDEETRSHSVVAARGDRPEIGELVGVRFGHNAGLVSMVVQNRCPLPYRGENEGPTKVVLSKRVPWPVHPSLLVLPLVLHDRALGTLILGAKRRHAFGDSVRPTLEVLASHLAVSLSNARMVHKLETLATTDGLTGLMNRRVMVESGAAKIAAAARFDRRLAVLVADIDHFKRINDSYGHDIGDVVIRGLGEILKHQKRATDLVARFGGEEFVVLCEQTDEKGAMLLAERIRDELGRTTFRTAKGAVSVTCSIGLATFPDAGQEWDSLFRAADEALYVSKRSGRNRCTAWRLPRKTAAAGDAALGRDRGPEIGRGGPGRDRRSDTDRGPDKDRGLDRTASNGK
jgi:diguanylate cyclase (GGDEF)-like protein